MADSNGFKLPSIISQDIALIMSYVDPPTPPKTFELGPQTSNNTKVRPEDDDDINSSGPEDEAEEVENVLLKEEAVEITGKVNATIKKTADSSSSDSSSDGSSSDLDEEDDEDKNVNKKPGFKRCNPDPVEMDLDEDGPPVPNDYIPTTHEIPLVSIPIPPLPDSSMLPDESLEPIGEIATILSDTIIIRGGGSSASGYATAKERRDAVLDEGSLLLLDDRTPLGYVWETFGPTHLPHYIVRIPKRAKTPDVADGVQIDKTIEAANALLDKATLFRPIYHMRSMSKFVFTESLSKIKGSDASNIHDEELPEQEQEFSDDEAEANSKRLRRKGSRAPSRTPSRAPSVSRSISQHYDSYNGSLDPDYADDAGSLYGDSPYDIEGSNISFQTQENLTGASTSRDPQMTSPAVVVHQNPELQRALQNARMSRKKRTPQASEPLSRSFSYEEYDPRMPRPPSPTGFAIAQATGQWPNGAPFIYGSNAPDPYAQPPNGYNYFPPPAIQTGGATPHINPNFIPPFPLPPNTDDTYMQNDTSMRG